MKLLEVAYYKLKMLVSDRIFFTAMVVVPLLITLIAGHALRNEKLNIVPVAFVDDDETEYSKRIINAMSEKDGFKVFLLGHAEAAEALENSNVEQVFIIKEGFEQSILHGEAQGVIDVIASPSSYTSGFTSEVVAGEVTRLVTDQMAAEWVDDQYGKLDKPNGPKLREEVRNYLQSLWEPGPLMTVNYKEITGGSDAVELEEGAGGSGKVPVMSASASGFIIAFIMFFLLFGSGWLVEEKNNGTIRRLAVVPGALKLSFYGNVLALYAAGILQVILFDVIIRLLFGVRLFDAVWAGAGILQEDAARASAYVFLGYLIISLYILAVIAIGLFLSSVFKTQAQLQAVAPVAALLTSFAGGCFWSFLEVPRQLQLLARLTPQGWALEAINALMTYDPYFTSTAFMPQMRAIAIPAAVMAAAIVVLLPLGYYMTKRSTYV